MPIGRNSRKEFNWIEWNVFIVLVFIFIISRFSGIRFWHLYPDKSGLVARVSQSLISPPFLIKIKHPLTEGIFDLWMQMYKWFWEMQKKYGLQPFNFHSLTPLFSPSLLAQRGGTCCQREWAWGWVHANKQPKIIIHHRLNIESVIFDYFCSN